jgi:hypothetical protein
VIFEINSHFYIFTKMLQKIGGVYFVQKSLLKVYGESYEA